MKNGVAGEELADVSEPLLRLLWEQHVMVVPQADVERIELVDGIRASLDNETCAGWLEHDASGMPVPVFRMGDDSMRPCHFSRSSGYIVVFRNHSEPFAIWCDDSGRIAPGQLSRPQHLPGILARRRPPVNGLAMDTEGRPVLFSRAALLAGWLFGHCERKPKQ